VRLVSTKRGIGRFEGVDAVRIVGKVAISIASPRQEEYLKYFAFVSPCQEHSFAKCSPVVAKEAKLAARTVGWAPGNCHTGSSGSIVSDVNILIIDNDSASQHALQQVFDAEGWRVSVVPLPDEAMRELARGRWTLAVANVALADVAGPLFTTLKTLAQTEADPSGGQKLLRVLFLVPALSARRAQPVLEHEGLPFVSKPFHLHDLLEKVSDLLMEVNAIPQPIRDTQLLATAKERKQRERRSGSERRRGQMFASRDDYMMTEEEIADFERQEEAERRKRLEDAKKRDVL
jgi:DNA-binding response OmpR family regulator